MVRIGLSEVIGSWKIIEMWRPRILRISSSSSVSKLRPSKLTRPLGMRPVWRGRSRMIESAETDLPEPDSPTMATTSPRSTWKLKPSTARTTPRDVKKWTCKSSTSSKGGPFSEFTRCGCVSTRFSTIATRFLFYYPPTGYTRSGLERLPEKHKRPIFEAAYASSRCAELPHTQARDPLHEHLVFWR